MNPTELFRSLMSAYAAGEVETLLGDFIAQPAIQTTWLPVGGRENNRGTIEASSDPGRSLVERLTNGIDAVIELEHESHRGSPVCRSPKEAALAWLGVPEVGLSGMTPGLRRILAQRVKIILREGEGKSSRSVEIRDAGIGLSPAQMPATILSLNESNKMQKHYLAGAYGQGGSSTFAAAKTTLIASRVSNDQPVGFTIVRYEDLPAETFKTGRYVYLSINGSVLEANATLEEFPIGTSVKHFGYDLSNYASPIGYNSLYGLLNQVLFDPVMPVWLDASGVYAYGRRVIKGSRNALNGAIDDGDESAGRTALSHHMPLFTVNLGAETGYIKTEYWVLERPATTKRPTAAFVNPSRPIILTIHGQNQAEMPQALIRKGAELPYLSSRLICHVDCNGLTAAAKRALFVSNREDARRGRIYDLVEREVVNILRSDDELIRVNNEARDQGRHAQDETAIQEMRREVAQLLRMQGVEVAIAPTVRSGNTPQTEIERPHRPHRPRPRSAPLAVNDPPTFIRIVWEEEAEIPFYAGQRRYLRIETDAPSNYHNPNDLAHSRINLIATGLAVTQPGSTPLEGGRMRAIYEASLGAVIGGDGIIRIELSRPGQPMLADERRYLIVASPPVQTVQQQVSLPPFRAEPVQGPDDPRWRDLSWPEDTGTIASSAEMEEGELVIYYSAVFPKFANQRTKLESKDLTLAQSFTKRYEIWLCVHSLMLRQAEQARVNQMAGVPTVDEDEEAANLREQAERCRIANLAALFAAREVQLGANLDPSE